MIAAAHHASLVGAMVVPGLVGLMVLPAFIARCFGWGDDDGR